MHLLYQEMMKEYGVDLLSRFGVGKEERFAILNGVRDFCVNAGYPKDLMRDLFLLVETSEVVEGQVMMEWRDVEGGDERSKKELKTWFDSVRERLA